MKLQQLAHRKVAVDQATVLDLSVRHEAPISDAPLPRVDGESILYLIILSPAQPKDPKRRR
jgi:hypothetical protein